MKKEVDFNIFKAQILDDMKHVQAYTFIDYTRK